VRRKLIQAVLPLVFCCIPPLAGILIAMALPAHARAFYLAHLTALDVLILTLGVALFFVQMLLALRALRWRINTFDERPDPWLSHLGQAAEWFPLLGLLGTVAGILQTFSSMGSASTTPQQIISLYAPAITATGSGLFMALLNILPTWLVLIGRDLIRTLGGEAAVEETTAPVAEPSRAGAKETRTAVRH
jgi:hypothetical protein